jgi:hypothetical protein
LSPAHVAEPTYAAIRGRLMAGAWPMGHRLEAGRLAEELGVSISPVRDGLNRLVGERLVDLVPGVGFHVPRLTEGTVRDLLSLNLVLLRQIIDALPLAEVTIVLPAEGHANRTNALFSEIAALGINREIAATVRAIGARLHVIREREPDIIPTAVRDVERMHIMVTSGDGGVPGALLEYHALRDREVGRLLAVVQA